jgi:hypothetical protein
MLRPIAENPFADRQIAEFQFAEKIICRKFYLPKILFAEKYRQRNFYFVSPKDRFLERPVHQNAQFTEKIKNL